MALKIVRAIGGAPLGRLERDFADGNKYFASAVSRPLGTEIRILFIKTHGRRIIIVPHGENFPSTDKISAIIRKQVKRTKKEIRGF